MELLLRAAGPAAVVGGGSELPHLHRPGVPYAGQLAPQMGLLSSWDIKLVRGGGGGYVWCYCLPCGGCLHSGAQHAVEGPASPLLASSTCLQTWETSCSQRGGGVDFAPDIWQLLAATSNTLGRVSGGG
jgi:hypothetical protein